MTAWIMIIIIHGWGAGLGSGGNAIVVAEFSSEERCRSAAQEIRKAEQPDFREGREPRFFCVPR